MKTKQELMDMTICHVVDQNVQQAIEKAQDLLQLLQEISESTSRYYDTLKAFQREDAPLGGYLRDIGNTTLLVDALEHCVIPRLQQKHEHAEQLLNS